MTAGEIVLLVLGTLVLLGSGAVVYAIVKLKQMQDRDLEIDTNQD